jgi:hypothetical protein
MFRDDIEMVLNETAWIKDMNHLESSSTVQTIRVDRAAGVNVLKPIGQNPTPCNTLLRLTWAVGDKGICMHMHEAAWGSYGRVISTPCPNPLHSSAGRRIAAPIAGAKSSLSKA